MNKSTTDTPRTDAAKSYWDGTERENCVSIAFARGLERELAALQAEVERLRAKLSRLIEFAERYTTCRPGCPADYDGPNHCTCGYQKGIEEVWALRTTLNPTNK